MSSWLLRPNSYSERGMSAKVVNRAGIAIFEGDVDFRKSKTQVWRNMDSEVVVFEDQVTKCLSTIKPLSRSARLGSDLPSPPSHSAAFHYDLSN